MKVLIVDDDELVRETLREIVEYAGHEPIVAVDRDEAMSQVGKRNLNVALIDLHLVAGSLQRDGLVVAGACVESGISRTYLMTGAAPDPDTLRQVELLEIILLQKPLSMAVVVECLREL